MKDPQLLLIKKLCEAIKQKRVVQFYYESVTNENKAIRLVEPYLVGINTNGKPFLSGWFIPAERNLRNNSSNHKNYLIEQMRKDSLMVTEKKFSSIKVHPSKINHTPTIEVLCKVDID